MNRLLLRLSFLPVLLSACTPAMHELEDKGQALLEGYRTQCNGELVLVGSGVPGESTDEGTRLVVPAGEQNLTVRFEDQPVVVPGAGVANYACSMVSQHQVKFMALPGSAYRFDVSRSKDSTGRITAYELVGEGPKAWPVPTNSKQLEARKECRFFPVSADCGFNDIN